MWLSKKKYALTGSPYDSKWIEYLCSKEGIGCSYTDVSEKPATNHIIAQNILYELLKNPSKYSYVIMGTTHLGWWDVKKRWIFDGNKLLKGNTALTEDESVVESFNRVLMDDKGLYTKYFANMRMISDYLNDLTVIQKVCEKNDIIFMCAAWEDPFDWKLIYNYCKENGEHDRNEPAQPYWLFDYEMYFKWLVHTVTKTLDEPLFGKSTFDFIYGSGETKYTDRDPENPGWSFPVYMGLEDTNFVRYPQRDIPILTQLKQVHFGDDNEYKYFKDDQLETLSDSGSRRIAEIYYEFYKKTYLENKGEGENVSNQAEA